MPRSSDAGPSTARPPVALRISMLGMARDRSVDIPAKLNDDAGQQNDMRALWPVLQIIQPPAPSRTFSSTRRSRVTPTDLAIHETHGVMSECTAVHVTRPVAAAVWDRSDRATVDQLESVTVDVVSAAAVREASVSVAGYSWVITLQTFHRPNLTRGRARRRSLSDCAEAA